MHTNPIQHVLRPGCQAVLSVLAASLLFTACGSGGGGTSASPVNLSGVAATGNPVLNATIAYSCASGSGSIPANATTGAYSATNLSITLPCVLEATGIDSNGAPVTLHSIASGSGSNVTANVTPLTELVVAQLTGTDPTAYFANVQNGTTPASTLGNVITATAVNSAATAVAAMVNPMLTDLTQQIGNATDILSGSLAAGSHSGQDAALDTLKFTLSTNGTTLSALVTSTASASPANVTSTASTGGASGTAATSTTSASDATSGNMLPANLLLRPKATACASLRSGTYQIVVAKAVTTTGTDIGGNMEVATLDATNATYAAGPTWTWEDGSTTTMTADVNQSCHYTLGTNRNSSGTPTNSVGSVDMMVAPSGLVVLRSVYAHDTELPDVAHLVLAIPVQTIGVNELVGKWNVTGWAPLDAPNDSIIKSDIATISSDGAIISSCPNGIGNDPSAIESTCINTTAAGTLTTNTSGGFNISGGEAGAARMFAFRAGNGTMVLTFITSAGEIDFFTRYRTLTLPAVNDNNNAWNVQINPLGIASDALQYSNFLVTAASGNSLTRTATNMSNHVSHSQTLSINTARNGWLFRDAGSTTASDNSAVTIRKMYNLKLGVGLSAYYLPSSTTGTSNARFGLSVTQP